MTRTTTLNSYLYKEYEDDDDLQALVASYNDAMQNLVDWNNTVNLPYYPGLSGGLLDWVAEGLYGSKRTSLASPVVPSIGAIDTFVMDSLVLGGGSPSSQIFYQLTDDVFQRILTWNFYKGDGKRFSMRWLKRRIIRFLVGVNGVDPQPYNVDGSINTNFTIGAETTTAVGVVITSNNIVVSIDQSLLSLQTQLVANVISLFQLAFQGGILELPARFGYVVNIVTNFVAITSPSSQTSSTSAFTQTTGTSAVEVLGGTGIYTYAWTWQSGGSGITIDTPSAMSTSFTATGMAWGDVRSGVALITVTDTVSSLTAVATVAVTITCTMPNALVTEGSMLSLLTEGSGIPIVVEP